MNSGWSFDSALEGLAQDDIKERTISGTGTGAFRATQTRNRLSAWQIWIDTGGTFTDCIARDPAGELRRCKVLSSGALRDRVEAVEDDAVFA